LFGFYAQAHILADLFTQNLRRYAAGEPLINVVDKKKGY
jgi:hypothetical protein